ncbi:hypothetical protein B6V73_13150 [Thioclava sp. JM3]|uniref:hypothetical protein n=1 Tax=Thioclava sp. JM3 TaxID=1973004 RepID=UPI000B548EBA|nr:hypothetical protein [Thioclava sp. JM3]OWY16125.1 hypothetical protein B6V73_13150 [Thioclava sp. JM3]
MTGGTGSDWFGVDWNEGDAPVTVTDFGQTDPIPAAPGEYLGIEVDDLAQISDFTVSQSSPIPSSRSTARRSRRSRMSNMPR